MDPDGKNKRSLVTRRNIGFRHPRKSPDGKWVSYFSVGKGHKPRIWVMDKVGTSSVALTSPNTDGISRQASWSPDGGRLVYASRKFGDFDIWTMNADGSDKQRVTRIPGNEGKPVWSSDGRSVAFLCADCRGTLGSDLYIITKK